MLVKFFFKKKTTPFFCYKGYMLFENNVETMTKQKEQNKYHL